MHNYRPSPPSGWAWNTRRSRRSIRAWSISRPTAIARPADGTKAAYDDIIQAGSGLAALQTVVAGQPRFLPTIVADKTSSNGVVSALLAALFARERTGKGQAIEVPMYETLVSFVMVEHLYGETFRPALETAGYKRVLNKERRPYPSKDGFFALLPYTDGHWKEFCGLVGRPDLAADARFTSLANPPEERRALLRDAGRDLRHPHQCRMGRAAEEPRTCRTGRSTRSTTCSSIRSSWRPASGRKSTIRPRASCACPTSRRASARPSPRSRRLQPRLGEHSVEVLREAGFTARRDRRHAEIGRHQDGVRSRGQR